MPAVIGIDLGSSDIKVGVFGLDGVALGMGHVACAMQQLAPGRFEQDPERWWAAVVEATRLALAEAGSSVRPMAIAVAAQGPTTLPVDAQGRPVRPAIGWMDTRASAELAELSAQLGVDGWRLGTLPHERWLARPRTRCVRQVRWFLTAWDWLGLRLSGVAAASTQAGQSALVGGDGPGRRSEPDAAPRRRAAGTGAGPAG